MIPPVSPGGTSLTAIEAALTSLSVALALFRPAFAEFFFIPIESLFARLARRRTWAVATVGLTALLLRVVTLPWNPIPHPFILDAFSYLLAADTFSSGRLTNPTPAMWKHFETFQISMQPTYMSMYFPAHGMVLAAGKVLTGNPWFGLLCVTATMCAALCWMLQAWLPPTWALLGGMLAVMRLGLFSYWINTYSGGGSIAALGGALVLGALPRLIREATMRDAIILAIGFIILANSRPYEGMLLCLVVAACFVRDMLTRTSHPPARAVLRITAAPACLFLVAALAIGYYNFRVFGSPFTEPYQLNRATYAIAPHFVLQAPHPEPVYRHAVMRSFYTGWELDGYRKVSTWHGYLTETPLKVVRAILFFLGIALLPALFLLHRALLDRRIRILVLAVAVLAFGMLFETWLIPHYLSPFTAAFYAIVLQCMRHLYVWPTSRRPAGAAMVRLLVTSCVVLVALRTFAQPLHLQLAAWPTAGWSGSKDFGAERARVLSALEKAPGRQLALVRYSGSHNDLDDWVFNAADIDASKVIWAREMSPPENDELLRFYKDRTVWLIQPDMLPAQISRYPVATSQANELSQSMPVVNQQQRNERAAQ